MCKISGRPPGGFNLPRGWFDPLHLHHCSPTADSAQSTCSAAENPTSFPLEEPVQLIWLHSHSDASGSADCTELQAAPPHHHHHHLQAHMMTAGDCRQVSQGIFWPGACDDFPQRKKNIFWCFNYNFQSLLVRRSVLWTEKGRCCSITLQSFNRVTF